MMARLATIGIFLLLFPGVSFAQNPYYDHGTFPATNAQGTSAAMRAELDLIEAGFAKLPTLSGNGNKVVVVNSGATALIATDAPIPSGTAFPSSPSVNALFIITDDATPAACDSAAGTEVTLCRWDGAAWVPVLGATTVTTLDQAFDGGNEIDGATSANPLIVGNGTQKGKHYGDASKGYVIEPVPLGDSVWRCWTNYNCVIRDEEGAASIFTLDPDATTTRLMGEYGTNYRPRGYFFVPAGAFVGDGTNCPAAGSAVIINSGPKVVTMICGSGANGDMDFDVVMPMDWDGGTLIFEASYTQTAANTSAMNSDIKAQCRGAGETPSSTWGTAIAIDDAAVTGSSAEDKTASAAVTPAGTCAAGDHLFARYTLDVTGTTTPEATLNFYGIGVYYSKQYWGN